VAVPVYQDVRERELKAQADADYLAHRKRAKPVCPGRPDGMQPLMQLVAPSESDRTPAPPIEERRE
jgi:hypothetical protein